MNSGQETGGSFEPQLFLDPLHRPLLELLSTAMGREGGVLAGGGVVQAAVVLAVGPADDHPLFPEPPGELVAVHVLLSALMMRASYGTFAKESSSKSRQ